MSRRKPNPGKQEYPVTPKELLFCYEYVKNPNSRRAAILAGYNGNVSHTGKLLLLRKGVTRTIEGLMEERRKELTFDARRILDEAGAIALSDIHNYIDSRTGRFRDFSEVDTRAVQSVSIDEDGKMKIKLHDKNKSLELLFKYFKLIGEGASGNLEIRKFIDDLIQVAGKREMEKKKAVEIKAEIQPADPIPKLEAGKL